MPKPSAESEVPRPLRPVTEYYKSKGVPFSFIDDTLITDVDFGEMSGQIGYALALEEQLLVVTMGCELSPRELTWDESVRTWELLSLINESIWLGSFILRRTDPIIYIQWTYTLSLQGREPLNHIECDDIFTAGFDNFTRFSTVFRHLLSSTISPTELFQAATMETIGSLQ